MSANIPTSVSGFMFLPIMKTSLIVGHGSQESANTRLQILEHQRRSQIKCHRSIDGTHRSLEMSSLYSWTDYYQRHAPDIKGYYKNNVPSVFFPPLKGNTPLKSVSVTQKVHFLRVSSSVCSRMVMMWTVISTLKMPCFIESLQHLDKLLYVFLPPTPTTWKLFHHGNNIPLSQLKCKWWTS